MKIEEINDLFRRLQELHPEMPLGMAYSFFVIASKDSEGVSLTDLANRVSIGLASASRYVAALGVADRRRDPGLGLVEAREDPLERRKKIIKLTPKGRAFINKVVGR